MEILPETTVEELFDACQSDIGVIRLLDAKDRLNEELDKCKRELSESRLAESMRIHLAQKMTADRDKARNERDDARAVVNEYKCQLADIVEKNRKMQGDYESLLKKVGEQVSVIGRLKGQADRAKTCPRCATLESVLQNIHRSLSRRIGSGRFLSSDHKEAFNSTIELVCDYMAAVDVKPQEEAPDVTI